MSFKKYDFFKTIFSFILSPFQEVSFINFIFNVYLTISLNFVTVLGGELHKVHDCCLFDCLLFIQSYHHFSR